MDINEAKELYGSYDEVHTLEEIFDKIRAAILDGCYYALIQYDDLSLRQKRALELKGFSVDYNRALTAYEITGWHE